MTSDVEKDIARMEDNCSKCRTEMGAKFATHSTEVQQLREKLIVIETKWDIRDRDVAALKKVVVEGNGVPSLQEQFRVLKSSHEDLKREVSSIKTSLDTMASKEEDRDKERRNGRLALWIAVISAIGTIAAGAFTLFGAK